MWKPRRSSERKFKTFSELFEFPMKILLNDFVFHLPSNCLNGTFFKVCSKSLRQIIMKSITKPKLELIIIKSSRAVCEFRTSLAIDARRFNLKAQSEALFWKSNNKKNAKNEDHHTVGDLVRTGLSQTPIEH